MTQTVNVIPVELNEMRAASTADGGTALTSTSTGASSPTALGIVPIPYGSDYVSITPRNLSGAAVVKIALNPYLSVFWTDTSGVNIINIGEELQDGDSVAIAIDDLPTFANGGAMYVGSRIPFRGVSIEVGSDPNGTGNDLTVNYWTGGSWVDISDTDSTDTGASLAVDGTVLWTVPDPWPAASLKAIGTQIGSGFEFNLPSDAPRLATPMYWTRWEWTNAMDSSTDINAMYALAQTSKYAEYLTGQTFEIMVSKREIASVQGVTNAGTANLLVNVGTLVGSEFE
jgi:hypothetical protein